MIYDNFPPINPAYLDLLRFQEKLLLEIYEKTTGITDVMLGVPVVSCGQADDVKEG